MPNNVLNKLVIHGTPEQISEIKLFLQNPELGIGSIDFNSITPMPKWVYCEGVTEEIQRKYGSQNCWYDWSISNWGTKWNAYYQIDPRTTFDTIYFTTAWSEVTELIMKLGRIFPDVEFEYAYSMEAIGEQVGWCKFKGLDLIDDYVPTDLSIDCYEMGMKIHQYKPEDIDLYFNPRINNYEYNDEVDHNNLHPLSYNPMSYKRGA